MPWSVVAAGVGAVGANMAAGKASKGADANNAISNIIAVQQQNQANEQWARYKQIYAPLEDEFAAEAQDRGSVANQNKAAADAAAATTAAYATARERLSKTPGLSPQSQKYLQEMNKINLGEAASSATGQTAARSKVIQEGDAMRADALNVGRGLPASAAGSLAAAGATNAANRAYNTAQADKAAGVAGGIGNAIGGIVNSKGFQNWMSSTFGNTDTYSSINNSAAANGYGNTFQQNGYSADIAYG